MFAGVLPKRAAPVGRDDQRERISRADADLHVDARGSLQEAGAATRWRSICRRIHLEASFAKPHMVLRQSRYPLIDADDDSVANILAQTDAGFMTLLPPKKVEGLSTRRRASRGRGAGHGRYCSRAVLRSDPNDGSFDAGVQLRLSTPRRVRNIRGYCATPFPSSSTRSTTPSSIAYCPASRRGSPPNTRRSRSATTPFGLPRNATATWPR